MDQATMGPLISTADISAELRRRRTPYVLKTVSASNRELLQKKVKLEEADGWVLDRKNLKSVRMVRPKPPDEQLEDEIWCILALMGFKEMSHGRHFQIPVGSEVNPRQIDVFAKDDEVVLIVECTQRDTPGRKRMETLIDKIKSIREPIHKSITSYYGRDAQLKIKHVIATRNIAWSDADLGKCSDANISVISDAEIEYYQALVKHLRSAARFQLLAHMFGGTGVPGVAKKVVATRGKMGSEKFYTFLIKPEELMKIAYVGHKASRDIDNLSTYQRMLQPARLKKIASFICDGGKFPTNIVLNLKTKRRGGLRFEEKEKIGEESFGILHLPANYASAWIIDGQHRLYGYAYAADRAAFKTDTSTLPVLAYENLSAGDEMNLFIDINSKQVKVSPNLLVELHSDLHWQSPNSDEAFQALLSRIASRLNSDRTSPIFDRVGVTGKKKSQYRCLTQKSLRDGLDVARLVGYIGKGSIIPGPLSTDDPTNYQKNLKKSVDIISESLRLFANKIPMQWKAGDGQGGYICTNNGIRALFHVIKDLADHITSTSGVSLWLLTADEVSKELSPYLDALAEFLKEASSQEIASFRRIGSSLTAVRQQSYGLEALIQTKFPQFQPAGLQEYLDSRDEAGTTEAATKVTSIHRKLFEYVIGALREHYGSKDKAWWTKGIPLDIRQKCSAEWEAKNREDAEESHLYLISYIDICIHNWDLVKDVISLDEKDKDNKKKNTTWIKDLNEIRKKTTHPERGPLSKEQVALVNEIHEKVERHFPMDAVELQVAS